MPAVWPCPLPCLRPHAVTRRESLRCPRDTHAFLRCLARCNAWLQASQFLDGEKARQLEEPYCDEADSDEALPLGPGFQHLVSLFATIVPATSKSNLAPQLFASMKNIQQTVLGAASELASHIARLDVLDHGDGELQPHHDRLTVLVRLFQARQDSAATSDRKAETRTLVKMLTVVRAVAHNIQELGLGSECKMMCQNTLTSIGAVLPTTTLLSDASPEVVTQALATLGSIIDGGNKSAQDVLACWFLGTREEDFFRDAEALITKSNEWVLSQREQREQRRQADEKRRELRLFRILNKGSSDTTLNDKDLRAALENERFLKFAKASGYRGLPELRPGLDLDATAKDWRSMMDEVPINTRKERLRLKGAGRLLGSVGFATRTPHGGAS